MVNRIAKYDSQPDDDGDEPPFDADDFDGGDDDDDDGWVPCATVEEVGEVSDNLDEHLKQFQQHRETMVARMVDVERAINLLVFIAVCVAGGFAGWLLWGR